MPGAWPESVETFYHREVCWLAHTVAQRCERVFAAVPASPPEYLHVAAPVHQEILLALSAAGRISRLLDVPKKRDKKHETQAEFEQRKRRALGLRKMLKRVDTTVIDSRSVRNSLEHFDQRIDRFVVESRQREFSGPAYAMQNFVVSSWQAVEEYEQLRGAEIDAIKLYVAAERTYYNFGDSVDLGTLHDEASSILGACDAKTDMEVNDPRFGEMGVIHAFKVPEPET